jgi:predicted ATPase
MYLKNIVIKNIGPIEKLSVELPFKGNGDPKPIIFVGENGSGKTILQSQIIDGFYEIGSSLFDDIGIQDGLRRKFYKISGDVNLQIGKDKGFSLLKFVDNENNNLECFDKVGEIKKEDFTGYIKDFSLSPSYQKAHTVINEIRKEKLQNEWRNGAYFYQPAYRYEEPFWKNEPFVDQIRFEDKKRFLGELGRELEIISSTKNNKSFLMDLVLDFVTNPGNVIDKITWQNINNVLSKIKKRNDIRFGIGQRGGYRVSIVEEATDGKPKNQLLPSIDHLSLGESILLNLFINIVRHGDTPPKLTEQIQGIVAIDEIDVHLHTDLQNSVLPELIQMFPKIQFIITTHSPLFLLGMRKIFGVDGFEIRNMPKGELITTERFSEFENAYNVLKETERFEDDVRAKIVNKSKPVVFVEGPTDVKYIIKAYELYNKPCDAFDIEIIGEKTNSGTKNSNNKALKDAHEIFRTNLNLLKKKVILLNDPEESVKNNEYKNLLYIRKMPKYDQNPLQKGIENLFEKSLIDKAKEKHGDCFEYRVIGGVEKNHKIADGKKQTICDWIWANGTKDDFKNFKEIFEIIDSAININK